jgi:hypothetical protein
MCCSGSQGSVIGIVIRPWAEHLGIIVQLLAGARGLFSNMSSSLWDHPASCAIYTGGFFHWVKFVVFDICIASDPMWLYIFHFISFLVGMFYNIPPPTTHCSLLDVPTFATRSLQLCRHMRAPSGGSWNCGREMFHNFA